jgi:hypothetical protein
VLSIDNSDRKSASKPWRTPYVRECSERKCLRKTLKTREKKNLLPARQKCVCADSQLYQNVLRETFWYDQLELQTL